MSPSAVAGEVMCLVHSLVTHGERCGKSPVYLAFLEAAAGPVFVLGLFRL